MSSAGGKEVKFAKYSGCGNDFIIIDRTKYNPPIPASELAKRLCERAVSVGADGLILLKKSKFQNADLEWEFYNSDGSVAEFCGNGARCAARFAFKHGLVNASSFKLKTDAGIVKATVKNISVKLEFEINASEPKQMNIALTDKTVSGYFLITGVPHFVIFKQELLDAEVVNLGREIRFHKAFAPNGTNVDFCKIEGKKIFIRTYERGVEDETLACGSGATAAGIVAHKILRAPKKISIIPKSGEALFVNLSLLKENRLVLEGPSREIYVGKLAEPWPDED